MLEYIGFGVSSRGGKVKTVGYSVSILLLLSLPVWSTGYFTSLMAKAMIFAIFAISVDLVWGYGGILTFGHAVFFGLGAYITAIILEGFGLISPGGSYIVLFVVTACGLASGLVIAGLLFYRDIDDRYFTIITLAIAVIAQQIAVAWTSVTGGYNGILGIPDLAIGIPFVAMVPLNDFRLYYFTVFVLGVSLVGSSKLMRSEFGHAIKAIKTNEKKATSLGYNTPWYKTILFGLSGALAAFAGAIYTSQTGFASPSVIGFLLSTEVLLWVIIGGRGTLYGASLGAIALFIFKETVRDLFPYSWSLLMGIVLVLVVIFLPEGLMGARQRTQHWIRSILG